MNFALKIYNLVQPLLVNLLIMFSAATTAVTATSVSTTTTTTAVALLPQLGVCGVKGL